MTIALRWDVVTPHQAAVAHQYLEGRHRERHHLVVYLSGATPTASPRPTPTSISSACTSRRPEIWWG
jgi:hypothetical protein